MTRKKNSSPPCERAEAFTTFEVDDGGTLSLAGCVAPETRAGCYGVDTSWSRSPQHLADEMGCCRPLAWAIGNIYDDARCELEEELARMQSDGGASQRKIDALKRRLEALPEEPEEGAEAWLVSLTKKAFKERVVPEITAWLEESPDDADEWDYIPNVATGEGYAFEFFDNMTPRSLETLGVKVIDGDCPGNDYQGAELRCSIAQANRAAQAAGIPVRFVAAGH